MAISIQNNFQFLHDRVWEERELQYKNIMNKYTLEERQKFGRMFVMLTEEFEHGNISDMLGEIYMSQKSGNSKLGQFFTPFHLSELCARTVIEEQLKNYDGKKIKFNEPSVGGGGMLIAAIKVLEEKGIDYKRKVEIIAQDLDWNGVYMTYTQLSLLGVKAIVVQGDALYEPYHDGYDKSRVFRTPAEMGAIL